MPVGAQTRDCAPSCLAPCTCQDPEAAYALGLVELASVHHDLELQGPKNNDRTQRARVTRPAWMCPQVFDGLGASADTE